MIELKQIIFMSKNILKNVEFNIRIWNFEIKKEISDSKEMLDYSAKRQVLFSVQCQQF